MSTKKTKKVSRAKFCTEAGRGLRRRVPEGGSRLARCRWGTIPRANPTHDVFDYEAAGPGGTKIPFRLSVRGLLKPSRMTMGSGTEPFTAIGQFSLRRAEDAFDDPMDVGEDGFLEVLSGYVDDGHQLHAWTRSMDPEDAPLERALRNGAQRALDSAMRSQNPSAAGSKRRARTNPAPAARLRVERRGATPQANTVYADVRDFGGRHLGTLTMPHDGTRAGIASAAQAVRWHADDTFPGWSNIATRTIATDASGRPAWAVSPNGAHVEPLGSAGSDDILGTTTRAPRSTSAKGLPAPRRSLRKGRR